MIRMIDADSWTRELVSLLRKAIDFAHRPYHGPEQTAKIMMAMT